MSDDEEDRFLQYECRVPAAFWGEAWAAQEALKPDAPTEYVVRFMKYKKATKKTKLHYEFVTRAGKKGKMSVEEIKEYRAQGRFDGQFMFCSCTHTKKNHMLSHKFRRYNASKLLQIGRAHV